MSEYVRDTLTPFLFITVFDYAPQPSINLLMNITGATCAKTLEDTPLENIKEFKYVGIHTIVTYMTITYT